MKFHNMAQESQHRKTMIFQNVFEKTSASIFVFAAFIFSQNGFANLPFCRQINGFSARELSQDQLDWERSWGTRFLTDDDPAWKDEKYLMLARQLIIPQPTTYYGGVGSNLLREFQILLEQLGRGRLLTLTSSGTQANNLFFELAEYRYQNEKKPRRGPIRLLRFENPYGGSFGKSKELSLAVGSLKIPSPFISPWDLKTDLNANLKLLEKEKAALEFIRTKVEEDKEDIGGIFIEPVAVAAGVYVYRPRFLRQLRVLADKLNLPIFADEILSGGGRTGKFWAFEYAKGFIPDYVSFGKGLMIAGVFAPHRSTKLIKKYRMEQNHIWGYPNETQQAHPMALLQAVQVLNAIKDRGLIQSAERAGHKLQELYLKHFQLDADEKRRPRNLGLILGNQYAWRPLIGLQMKASSFDRLLPPLTLTEDDVEQIVLKRFQY